VLLDLVERPFIAGEKLRQCRCSTAQQAEEVKGDRFFAQAGAEAVMARWSGTSPPPRRGGTGSA